MVGSFLNSALKLDYSSILYKTPFFTAGELLDIYLLKEEKVIYSGDAMLEYMSLYRTYSAGVPSLLSQYNYADFNLDSIKLVDRQKLVRIYNFDVNSY